MERRGGGLCCSTRYLEHTPNVRVNLVVINFKFLLRFLKVKEENRSIINYIVSENNGSQSSSLLKESLSFLERNQYSSSPTNLSYHGTFWHISKNLGQ